MRPSAVLLRKGFWKRSLEELQRVSTNVLTKETIRVPERPYTLMDFKNPEIMDDIKAMSDQDIWGFSTVNVDHHPVTASEPAHMRWHGKISTDLPKGKPEVQRTGYAAWRNHDRPITLWGKSFWNLDVYRWLALIVKSDGRKYFVNVQTDSLVPTDIHQHRLYAKDPGRWETIMIPLSGFVRTNHGQVVEPQTEMNTQKVKSIGIGSTDRMVGPYDLSVARIWATNRDDGWHPDDGTPEPPKEE